MLIDKNRCFAVGEGGAEMARVGHTSSSGGFVVTPESRSKLSKLREMLDATEAEGGSYSTEDVRSDVRKHLDRLRKNSPATPD